MKNRITKLGTATRRYKTSKTKLKHSRGNMKIKARRHYKAFFFTCEPEHKLIQFCKQIYGLAWPCVLQPHQDNSQRPFTGDLLVSILIKHAAKPSNFLGMALALRRGLLPWRNTTSLFKTNSFKRTDDVTATKMLLTHSHTLRIEAEFVRSFLGNGALPFLMQLLVARWTE